MANGCVSNISFATLLALAAWSTPHALGDEPSSAQSSRVQTGTSGTLITHTDEKLERLIVIDTSIHRAAEYSIGSSGMMLIGTRDLDSDLRKEPKEAAPVMKPSEPTRPLRDVPGVDPPGIPRPEKSIRVQSSRGRRGDGVDEWKSTYELQGTGDAVYERYMHSMTGWTVATETIELQSYDGAVRCKSELRKGGATVNVDIHYPYRLEGFVDISISLSQPAQR